MNDKQEEHTLQAWRDRRQGGETFTTPTGLQIKVRRCSLMDLAEQGSIPAPLTGMVDAIFDQQDHSLTVDDVPEFIKVINMVVKAAVVDPPVADQPDETHVGLQELPVVDRLAIYNWANRPGALIPFRQEPG